MKQIEFQIPEGYVLDKEASTDSKLVYKKQSSFPKTWEESLLALTQLLNLRDEYSRHDCADDYKPYYYSIVYCENISNLKVLKTGHQTLFSFFREDSAQRFLENCRTLLHRVLGMIPYYN